MSSRTGGGLTRDRVIHRQTAGGRGVSRTDAAWPVRESGRYEEATVDLRTCPRSVAPRALRRALRHRSQVMFPLAVAVPLALLPIVSLSAALRWMALSSGGSA
jgi:hypothetical protein